MCANKFKLNLTRASDFEPGKFRRSKNATVFTKHGASSVQAGGKFDIPKAEGVVLSYAICNYNERKSLLLRIAIKPLRTANNLIKHFHSLHHRRGNLYTGS